MPLFDIIFVALFVAAWAILGLLAWTVASVATRGNAGIGMLPVAMAVGVVAGLAVPFLGATGGGGIWLSMVAAFALPSLLLAARRVRLSASRPRDRNQFTAHGNAE